MPARAPCEQIQSTLKVTHRPPAMPPVRPPLLHPPELLARIGKCLSFGCDEVQTRRAAGLVRRLAHDGATLRAAQLGALTGIGHGIVHRTSIELPKPTEGSSVRHPPSPLLLTHPN